jgi:hypothetical protein
MDHQKINNEKYIVFGLLVLSLVYWIAISLLSEGNPMRAEAYQHYMFSHYSFQYPELLLHHWGKPVYTLLSSPFSQFGYEGAKIFSVLIGILTAYFTWRIAGIARLNYRPVVFLLVIFTPYYALLMISSMTETLFSFFLILSIFLYLDKRPVCAAILLSFIPFVRSEGYAVILAFILVMLLNKKWKAIPFLLTGTIIYSVIGGFYYDDFLWVFTQSPYNPDGVEFYGTGEFLFYFKSSKIIFGDLISILIVVGTLLFLIKYTRGLIKKSLAPPFTTDLLILVPGIFFGFFLMQSFLWYKGMMGVYGSFRFIVSIAPLGALMALYGLNLIPPKIFRPAWLQHIVLLLIGTLSIVITLNQNPFPYPLSPTQLVNKEVADYIINNKIDEHKIWYADVSYFYFLDHNPFSKTKSEIMGIGRADHEFATLPGDYIIWDQHFSPNELSLPLERLLNSGQFELIRGFHPAVPFLTFNNQNYRVMLFKRLEPSADDPLFAPEWQSISSKYNLERDDVEILQFNPYEGTYSGQYKNSIVKESDSNQMVWVSGSKPYVSIIDHPIERITRMQAVNFYIQTEAKQLEQADEPVNLKLIVSVDREGTLIKYNSIDLSDQLTEVNTKGKVYHHMNFDAAEFSPGDNLKLYFWKVSGGDLWMDNTILVIKPAE